ncbi:hypothetical protein [Gluconacetobacter asukensis]|uniref:Uncharacterized protein n=1 Tax=Gluconacetobacter asukensis TaxID=1017181 RepID=A0A7W4J432_9PROT|nr:hypothetical protein [Gluconacetobacter asukensis]MBB2174262.1 hypothetical protein [Gluconacetobacter asukensis]
MKDATYASLMPEAHIDAVTASIAGVILSAAIMSSAGNYATKSTQDYATWQADLQADNVGAAQKDYSALLSDIQNYYNIQLYDANGNLVRDRLRMC